MKVDNRRRLGSSRCMSSGWLKGISAGLHTQQDVSSSRFSRRGVGGRLVSRWVLRGEFDGAARRVAAGWPGW